ncbi:MAG: GNAT family N-acetyltransferase [Rhodospirillaceae bacterium]
MSAVAGKLVQLSGLTGADQRASAVGGLTEIFFESTARTEFSGDDERRRFLARWTSAYLEHYCDDVWFWRDLDGTISGYLTGCRDSANAARYFTDHSNYQLFADYFAEFPAHLHVNCRAERRNVGIGARLVEAFVAGCRRDGLAGVHVVTTSDARNVRFYDRVGFTVRAMRVVADRQLVLLGRDLKAGSGL